ncbi:MAG: hypothetical protein EOM12_07440 [Verrucomicrobiae bacterium]|nr:hypothetical protein [Verrucomicrobiae bacterium]
MSVILTSTNIVASFITSSLMISQANIVSEKLELPLNNLPITSEEIKTHDAFLFTGKTSLGRPEYVLQGYIKTEQYSFFFKNGYLRGVNTINVIPPRSDAIVKKKYEDLLNETLSISKTNAYKLSTNWLCKLDVNLNKLNSEYELSIKQWEYIPEIKEEGILVPIQSPLLLPVFDVEWSCDVLRGGKMKKVPQVTITIDGRSGELVSYDVSDDSLFLSPRIQLINVKDLFAIPDEEFLKMDDTQKNNLLKRFVTPESFPPQKKKTEIIKQNESEK